MPALLDGVSRSCRIALKMQRAFSVNSESRDSVKVMKFVSSSSETFPLPLKICTRIFGSKAAEISGLLWTKGKKYYSFFKIVSIGKTSSLIRAARVYKLTLRDERIYANSSSLNWSRSASIWVRSCSRAKSAKKNGSESYAEDCPEVTFIIRPSRTVLGAFGTKDAKTLLKILSRWGWPCSAIFAS